MQTQTHPCSIFNLQQDTQQLGDENFPGLLRRAPHVGRDTIEDLILISAPFQVNLNTLDSKGNEK